MSKNLREFGQYWPAKKAAEYLGYSTTTLRKWAIQGRINVVLSPGGKYRYDVGTFLEVAQAASKDRLSKEAKKLAKKQADIAKKAEKVKADKLAKRKALAVAQRVSAQPVAYQGDEPPLPL